MIEVFNGEMNESLKDIQENTSKEINEMNKTHQDLKMQIESIKKTNRVDPAVGKPR